MQTRIAPGKDLDDVTRSLVVSCPDPPARGDVIHHGTSSTAEMGGSGHKTRSFKAVIIIIMEGGVPCDNIIQYYAS